MGEISAVNERLKKLRYLKQQEHVSQIKEEFQNWAGYLRESVQNDLHTTSADIHRMLAVFRHDVLGALTRVERQEREARSNWLLMGVVAVAMACLMTLTTVFLIPVWVDSGVRGKMGRLEELSELVNVENERLDTMRGWGVSPYVDERGRWLILGTDLRVQDLQQWDDKQAILLQER